MQLPEKQPHFDKNRRTTVSPEEGFLCKDGFVLDPETLCII